MCLTHQNSRKPVSTESNNEKGNRISYRDSQRSVTAGTDWQDQVLHSICLHVLRGSKKDKVWNHNSGFQLFCDHREKTAQEVKV